MYCDKKKVTSSTFVSLAKRSRNLYAVQRLMSKSRAKRIFFSISKISLAVYAFSEMQIKSLSSGGQISSYFVMIKRAAIPTSCTSRFYIWWRLKQRSMMLTVKKRVSGNNLKLQCIIMSQSTNVDLICSLIFCQLLIQVGFALHLSSVSSMLSWISPTNSVT